MQPELREKNGGAAPFMEMVTGKTPATIATVCALPLAFIHHVIHNKSQTIDHPEFCTHKTERRLEIIRILNYN